MSQSESELYSSVSNLNKVKSDVVSTEPSEAQFIEDNEDANAEKSGDDDMKTDFFEKFEPEAPSYGSIEGMREIEDDTEVVEGKSSIQTLPGTLSTLQELIVKPEAPVYTEANNKKLSIESERPPSLTYEISEKTIKSEADIEGFFDLPKSNPLFLKEYEESVHEEEEQSLPEEEIERLDRRPYYAKLDSISHRLSINKIKNNIFHKKISIVFKRRRVEHFLKDIEPPLDQVNKYHHKLRAFGKMIEINKAERHTITREVDDLRKKRDERREAVEKLFRTLQTKEELGYGLIYAKTGSVISSKLVERLLKRQNTQMNQVSTMRLKYFQLKEMLQEKLDRMDVINRIGSNFHLVDYEELKSENRSYADKIEEKEEELTRLRSKCQNTIQILAHMREKISALDWDLYDLNNELEHLGVIYTDTRQFLNETKKKKDYFRQAIDKEIKECGLLSERDLLYDMELVQRQCEKDQEQLDACIQEVELKNVQVRNLRKTQIKIAHDMQKKRKEPRKISILAEKSITSIKPQKQELHLYKGRASLCMPIIEQNMFKDLITIKPNPRVTNRGKYNVNKKNKF